MRRPFSAFVLLLATAACATGVGREAKPSTTPERLEEFLSARRDADVASHPQIEPGDVIRVDVAKVMEASREYRVSRNGTILMPLAGEVAIAGKTVEEAKGEIARRLRATVIDPVVEVKLVDVAGGEATITGAVERPGKLRLGMKGKTLLEALATAGGLTPDASEVIRIIPSLDVPPGLYAELPADVSEDAVEIAASDVLRGGANGPGRLHLRAGDVIEVVPREGSAVVAGPDPVAELGLASVETDAEVEPMAPIEETETRPAESRAAEEAREEPPPAAAPESSREEPPPLVREVVREEPPPPIVEQPSRVVAAPPEPPLAEVARRDVVASAPGPGEAPSRVSEADAESAALRAEIAALKRRIEESEVDLRNRLRQAEAENAQRQRDLEAARAEADAARRAMIAERARASELTSRIVELESGRGGPAQAVERADEGGGIFSAWSRARSEPSEVAAPLPPAPLPEPASPPVATRAEPQPVAASGEGRVVIAGRVQMPGSISLAEARTVTRVVARAAPAAGADLTRIQVRRGSGDARISVDLGEVRAGRSPDLVLEDGDSIFVP